ncbi:MAG: type II toxin-antitoxin system Phd/YefM family antitoxin [Candidatus Acidiferrales bacterium]
MEEINISKFKATCLEVLKRVQTTRKSILVTRRGQPIAALTPVFTRPRSQSWLGSLAGTLEINGDIVRQTICEPVGRRTRKKLSKRRESKSTGASNDKQK